MNHINQNLADTRAIVDALDRSDIERLLDLLVDVRDRDGRLFILGVGGSAGHASHAVNDFRKLTGIEAYAPSDNVSELTARINDEGWTSAYAEWLRASRIAARDMVLVLSVGGGDPVRGISTILVSALDAAREAGCSIGGIVGRDGGYTATVADACVIVPSPNPSLVTPHTEVFQAVIWHLLVSDPVDVVHQTRRWMDDWRTPTRIIVGTIRGPIDAQQAALAGAHVVTVPPAILSKLADHKYSRYTAGEFVRAGDAVLVPAQRV